MSNNTLSDFRTWIRLQENDEDDLPPWKQPLPEPISSGDELRKTADAEVARRKREIEHQRLLDKEEADRKQAIEDARQKAWEKQQQEEGDGEEYSPEDEERISKAQNIANKERERLKKKQEDAEDFLANLHKRRGIR